MRSRGCPRSESLARSDPRRGTIALVKRSGSPSTIAMLNEALGELVEMLGASHALVLDQSELVWGAFHPFAVPEARVLEDAQRFYLRDVAPRSAALKRGKRLYVCEPSFEERRRDGAVTDVTPPHFAKSFANIYVLVVWFDAPFEELEARDLVDAALPRIERLTLALPPPDGPHLTSGVGRKRG